MFCGLKFLTHTRSNDGLYIFKGKQLLAFVPLIMTVILNLTMLCPLFVVVTLKSALRPKFCTFDLMHVRDVTRKTNTATIKSPLL